LALSTRRLPLCGLVLTVAAIAIGAGPHPREPATSTKDLSIVLDIRSRHYSPPTSPSLEVCYSDDLPYHGTDPFGALANLPPSQIVRPNRRTRSISITVITGELGARFVVFVFKVATPIRLLGVFQSDSSGTGHVQWDMRDSTKTRVGRGVYQVSAMRDALNDNKFVVVE